ncbi:zwei Ig domain protein zig-8-like [Littorina saxatilis]|uniref:Ig-like domain-containing protein n=1 Tax=Littorina saxatilis TaxID=31220 RepID=A0AAN9C4H2_9CAEN
MLDETFLKLSWLRGATEHEWITDHGVQRRGLNLGVFIHRTFALFLMSLLLQVCQSQRDLDYRNPTTDLPPKFLKTPVDVTVREGSMAVLPCAVQYLGPRQVAWRRVDSDDKHFLTVGTFTWARGNNVMIEYHQEPGYITHWNLLIKNVREQDAGVYECQITAKKKIVRFVTLHISGPPVSEPGISVKGKEYVEKGDPIHLICNATGGSQIPEDIDWFKDGSKIDTRRKNHQVVITKFRSIEQQALISELIIDHSRMRDSGTYICRSSEKEIDSLKVTVLVADTNNVKRDKPEGTTSEESKLAASSSATRTSSLTSLTLLLWVLLCCDLVT